MASNILAFSELEASSVSNLLNYRAGLAGTPDMPAQIPTPTGRAILADEHGCPMSLRAARAAIDGEIRELIEREVVA